ncbi:MAG: S-ribosylhomocysteine lyase [Clostridia bacterium]|nr:S-ribosylhomocysteine lyase [Clostridia bacterium]
MEKIASFTVNHNTLQRGLYTSRVDGDVTTYDIRMKLPNSGKYLNSPAMHTVEHIVATYVRNSRFKDNIIYFGPMGCRTGFYLLTRNVEPSDVIVLVREAFEFLRDFEGEIPGVSAIECGNYLEHDLLDAKREAAQYLPVLNGYTVEMLDY